MPTKMLAALMAMMCSFCAIGGGMENLNDFKESAGLWRSWAPRGEISPAFSIDSHGGRSGGAALQLSTDNESQFGAWRRELAGINAGQLYRFSAWYRADGIRNERRSVIARLEWRNARGEQMRPPEYALDVAREGKWTQVKIVTAAPVNSTRLDIQLSLGFAAKATLRWDDISLAEETVAPDRIVRAATIFHRPRDTKSSAESVEQFCAMVEKAALEKPDVICLPEGITEVGTGKTYSEVAEPVPGPTTEQLGKLARQLHSYVVAGIYERAGSIVYNTAVLMDREGKLAGKYRKTHLPREEWEAGITAGDSYPVFDTDFGRVGLMVCWDVQFPEPCRAMGAKGAELVLLPIWGGSETLAKARAIENSLFLVTASYDMKTFIVDPAGEVLAEATREHPVVSAELHLDRAIFQPWLGNMKTRTWKERRPDIPLADAK